MPKLKGYKDLFSDISSELQELDASQEQDKSVLVNSSLRIQQASESMEKILKNQRDYLDSLRKKILDQTVSLSESNEEITNIHFDHEIDTKSSAKSPPLQTFDYDEWLKELLRQGYQHGNSNHSNNQVNPNTKYSRSKGYLGVKWVNVSNVKKMLLENFDNQEGNLDNHYNFLISINNDMTKDSVPFRNASRLNHTKLPEDIRIGNLVNIYDLFNPKLLSQLIQANVNNQQLPDTDLQSTRPNRK